MKSGNLLLGAIKVTAWRLGHRKRLSLCVCSSHSARKAGIPLAMKRLARPPGRSMPSTFTADELNFRVRNGNRWILVAIITGMAPLVGLEGTRGFEKYLKTGHF